MLLKFNYIMINYHQLILMVYHYPPFIINFIPIHDLPIIFNLIILIAYMTYLDALSIIFKPHFLLFIFLIL